MRGFLSADGACRLFAGSRANEREGCRDDKGRLCSGSHRRAAGVLLLQIMVGRILTYCCHGLFHCQLS